MIRFYANDHQWNAKTESREDHEGTVADKKTETPKEPAIFRRYMDADSDKKVASEEVEILSPDLWTLLEQVDGRWSDLVRNSANSIVVQTPFYHFVWSWDSLMSACEPKENDSAGQQQARKDLKELLDTLKGSDWLRSWARSLDSMKTSKKIKFEYLWTIFSHGRTVYARSYLNDMQMFKVISSSSPPYKGKRFRVTCGGLDWNGSQFAPYWYDFFIKEFDDERSITELTVFPTDFYGEGTIALRERLLERGRSYCKICRGEPVTFQYGYQGTAIVSISQLPRLKGGRAGESGGDVDEDDETPVVPVEISGSQSRVIVDNYWFLKSDQNTSTWGETPPLGPKLSGEVLDCPCGMCKDSPLKRQALEVGLLHKPDEVVKAFEDQGNGGLLLLPPRMLGFALREKVWGQFSVDKIKTLSYDAREEKSDPFWSELQLKDEYKELLMAFVDGHVSPRSRRAELDASEKDTRASDVIDGKGQGVAILLHGPPGVGKTLTAETVALATRRPLLTVSVAEIGTKSTEAEARLEGVFADAARWEAVLLMDEADVFVEQRKKGDLERNALVSVLLRCLEYFDGERYPRVLLAITYTDYVSSRHNHTDDQSREVNRHGSTVSHQPGDPI